MQNSAPEREQNTPKKGLLGTVTSFSLNLYHTLFHSADLKRQYAELYKELLFLEPRKESIQNILTTNSDDQEAQKAQEIIALISRYSSYGQSLSSLTPVIIKEINDFLNSLNNSLVQAQIEAGEESIQHLSRVPLHANKALNELYLEQNIPFENCMLDLKVERSEGIYDMDNKGSISAQDSIEMMLELEHDPDETLIFHEGEVYTAGSEYDDVTSDGSTSGSSFTTTFTSLTHNAKSFTNYLSSGIFSGCSGMRAAEDILTDNAPDASPTGQRLFKR